MFDVMRRRRRRRHERAAQSVPKVEGEEGCKATETRCGKYKKRHFDSLLQLFTVASNLALSAKAVAIAAAHLNAMGDEAAGGFAGDVGNSHVKPNK